MFFLYLIVCLQIAENCRAQTPQATLNQDSVNYYLDIVEAGEKQVGKALARIGFLYQNAGRYNSALTYYDRALPLLNGEGNSIEAAEVHRAKGRIYEVFGDNAEPRRYYAMARRSYLRSSEIFQVSGNATEQMMINQHLADIYTKSGNLNEAIVYQNKVIKSLTSLYQDSLQRQAESFNDLLGKEVESSKDTIYVETEIPGDQAPSNIPLTNWRHLLILFLVAIVVFLLVKWMPQQNQVNDLQQEIKQGRLARSKLKQQNDELQSLNVRLTKTEKEQRKSSMTKDKIFSIISHDLRSPINTISGFLNILGAKMTSLGDMELKKLANDVTESVDRLTHFLDDLLKWSMSQLGQFDPQIVKINFKQLVQENYMLVKPQLKSKNIHFKASVPDDVAIYADINMLRLIIRNLISNSIKFTRRDGYIAIIVKHGPKGTSVIEVSDDGIGMSEEKLQSLFKFTGTSINGGTHNEGTGLGLLLCKEFALLNGGDIQVYSKLGEGTRFTITLPDHPTDPSNDSTKG